MNDPAPVVFVVDDDPSIRAALASLIRSVGLSVETFGSAREFLKRQRPDAPGCLVLDVRMPRMTGLELQRQLATAHAPIPIIFITAHDDAEARACALRAGAAAFLEKPFSYEVLLRAVQAALQCSRAGL